MTLPYVTPPTAVTGYGLPAADWNAQVRDSMEALAFPPKCMVYRTTSQAVGNAAVSNILWEAEAYDTDNIWTPGGTADRLTVPRDGLYLATLCAQWAINGTGARYIAIAKNGGGVAQLNSGGSAAWYVGGVVTAIQPMVAGDYFTAVVYQTSGVALNIDVTYPVNMTVVQIGR